MDKVIKYMTSMTKSEDCRNCNLLTLKPDINLAAACQGFLMPLKKKKQIKLMSKVLLKSQSSINHYTNQLPL